MEEESPRNEPPAEAVIEAVGLTRRYSKRRPDDPDHALADFDLRLMPGESALLVGPNGAGKSTALRLLSGIDRPTSGRARLLGASPRDMAVRRDIGWLGDASTLFPFLDARETLDFFAAAAGLQRPEARRRAESWSERLGLVHYGRKRVATYSLGMRRRLGLACVLIGEPRVLFLDEPTSGLDPEGMALFLDIIADQKARGASVVLSSHHLAHAEQLADRILVLRAGRTVLDVTIDDLGERVGARALTVEGLDTEKRAELARAIAEQGGELVADRMAESGLAQLLTELMRDGE